jgi:integrase
MFVSLTDRFCDRAKPQSRQTDYFDEVVTGLALRVSAKRKVWTFNYTSPATQKRARLSLGTYPATSLAAARARALEARTEVEAGHDPRRMAAGAMTVADLVEVYLSNYVRPNLRSARHVELNLKRNILPVLGPMKLSDLHRRDMNRVIDPVIDRGSPVQAVHVFKDLFAMARWAVGRGDLDHNPFEGMPRPSSGKPRERALNADEIRTLWLALPEAFSPQMAAILKLCLITAQRVGEVAGMCRSELDLDRKLWLLPGARTKNGHSHSVPLSELALGIIGGAPGTGDLIFDPFQNYQIAHRIEHAQCGLAHWTSHDLRRTALTRMAELGVPPIVIGHVANHPTTTKAGMTLGVYVQYPYEREKREALDLWADRLRGIVAGGAEVTQLAARRAQ